jgi:hypothetical protein
MPPAGARTSTSRRGLGHSAAAAIAAASESQAPAMAPTQANPTQAASTGRNVRARIDNSVATPGQVKTFSPLRAAEDFIKSHIESLREGIAPLCLDKGKKFLSLQHRYFTKAKTVIRMEQDDDYVPISARVDFKVKALKEAEELPEFIELQNETKALIKTHQQSLKLLIIKSCTIEEDYLDNAVNRHTAESIHAIVSLFLVAQEVSTSCTDAVALAILEDHGESILRHVGLEPSAFIILYRSTLQVNPVLERAAPAPSHSPISTALNAIFNLSWDHYLRQEKDNQLAISLKKQAKEVMLASHTEDATMDIDAEIPADRQQLKDLIRHEARAMAKTMIDSAVEEKLKSMRMPVSKNAGRGQQRPGASTKRNGKTKAKRGEQNVRRGSVNRNENRNVTPTRRDEHNAGWTQVSNPRSRSNSRNRSDRQAEGATSGSANANSRRQPPRSRPTSRTANGGGGRRNTPSSSR